MNHTTKILHVYTITSKAPRQFLLHTVRVEMCGSSVRKAEVQMVSYVDHWSSRDLDKRIKNRNFSPYRGPFVQPCAYCKKINAYQKIIIQAITDFYGVDDIHELPCRDLVMCFRKVVRSKTGQILYVSVLYNLNQNVYYAPIYHLQKSHDVRNWLLLWRFIKKVYAYPNKMFAYNSEKMALAKCTKYRDKNLNKYKNKKQYISRKNNQEKELYIDPPENKPRAPDAFIVCGIIPQPYHIPSITYPHPQCHVVLQGLSTNRYDVVRLDILSPQAQQEISDPFFYVETLIHALWKNQKFYPEDRVGVLISLHKVLDTYAFHPQRDMSSLYLVQPDYHWQSLWEYFLIQTTHGDICFSRFASLLSHYREIICYGVKIVLMKEDRLFSRGVSVYLVLLDPKNQYYVVYTKESFHADDTQNLVMWLDHTCQQLQSNFAQSAALSAATPLDAIKLYERHQRQKSLS